jgi:hypothetical protein
LLLYLLTHLGPGTTKGIHCRAPYDAADAVDRLTFLHLIQNSRRRLQEKGAADYIRLVYGGVQIQRRMRLLTATNWLAILLVGLLFKHRVGCCILSAMGAAGEVNHCFSSATIRGGSAAHGPATSITPLGRMQLITTPQPEVLRDVLLLEPPATSWSPTASLTRFGCS